MGALEALMVECPKCHAEIDHFDVFKKLNGEMGEYGVQWFDEYEITEAECPECNEEIPWDDAVKLFTTSIVSIEE